MALVLVAILAPPVLSQTSVPPPLEPDEKALAARDTFDRVDFSHDLLDAVLRERVSNGLVDYVSLRDDERFRKYLRRLAVALPEKMKVERDRLAFWVNAYNALTLYGVLFQLDVADPAKVAAWRTNASDGDFFKGYAYRVAGRDLTLDTIEHEIVRKEFREPRVHFALVCAATGCPPLRSGAYRGGELDSALDDQAKTFLSDTSKNGYEPNSKTLRLSPIFDWFEGDFEASGGRLAFVRRFLPNVAPDARIEFGDYDWSLNARPPLRESR